MKNKIFFSILIFILCYFSISPVLAEEVSTPGASPTAWQRRIQQMIENRKENLTKNREQAENRLNEQKKSRLQKLTQNVMNGLERRVNRLTEHIGRLEKMAGDFEAKGADVSSSREKINEAKINLETARANLAAVETKLDELLETEDLKNSHEALTAAIKLVQDDLFLCRKSLAEAVSLLKVQKGQLKGADNE